MTSNASITKAISTRCSVPEAQQCSGRRRLKVDIHPEHLAIFGRCYGSKEGRIWPLSIYSGYAGAAALDPTSVIRMTLAKASRPHPSDRSFAISRLGGAPNSRLYSRLNCDGLS